MRQSPSFPTGPLRWLAAAVALSVPSIASAVILYDSPDRNTTPPPPTSIAYTPWHYQAEFGNFLGTPIAPNYFLTAQHVGGAAQLIYQGKAYDIDRAFGTNGRFDIAGSDLAIWKITSDVPLYAPIYTGSSEVGQHTVALGRGTQRGDEVIVKNKLKGWLWGASDNLQSWGENDIDQVISSDVGDLLRFDFSAGKTNEGILSSGDSGGGLFINDGGVWKLAGINYSVSGPYSRTSDGASPFLGALFDTSGLFVEKTTGGPWLPTSGPSSAYSSRVSSRAPDIFATVTGYHIYEPSYTATASADVGEIHVPGTTTIGDGLQPISLTATHVRTGTLHILDQAKLVIRPNGTDSGVSRAASLKIDPAATFDLTDNDLVVDATAATRDTVLTDVTSWIAQARNSPAGRWTGPGLTSSSAAANPDTTLIPMLNDKGDGTPLFTTFGGLGVDANSILVKYSWNGDVNVDGQINADDYFRIDSGFLAQPANPTYRDGDFTFDHEVNADDYFLIDSAFLNQIAVPSPMSAVPEPSGLLLVGLLGCALASRKLNRTELNGTE